MARFSRIVTPRLSCFTSAAATCPLCNAVSAIICTRTESEVEEVFDSLSDIGGIEFYSFNTVGQVLRHMLLKVRRCAAPPPALLA